MSLLAPPLIFSQACSVSSPSQATSSSSDGATISESGISVNNGFSGTSGTGSGSSLSSASTNSFFPMRMTGFLLRFVGNSRRLTPAWMQSSTTAGIRGIENLSS
ncbi:hypothetical protein CIPAW_16G110500 [Carya illinoinensis]|uniref:Uncharacterized protein n=1 Tax=Carya illinoinensis TaxID=32201 RepID=A0A8T1N807_CARIL|nr:hypothetical protein CIPAW_16G110500 [Carya illinoinensis]